MPWYFAYGSNMDQCRIKERLKYVPKCEAAHLKGFSLAFNKDFNKNPQEGYANIVPDKQGIVEGVLYKVKKEDLDVLDNYEGVKNRHYRRFEVIVTTSEGQDIEAEVYIACQEKVRTGLKPSRKYPNHLLAH